MYSLGTKGRHVAPPGDLWWFERPKELAHENPMRELLRPL